MRVFIKRSILLGSLIPVLAGAATMNLVPGWNLVGNSDASTIDVSKFNDSAKFITVWKWNKATNKWAFYAPAFTTPAALAAYVDGKGYEVLTSINPKEGFWVNALVGTTLSDATATPPTPGTVASMLRESDLVQGWNLASSADGKTPASLSQGLSGSLNIAGKAITTLWAWDTSTTSPSWKFYAPSLDAQGGTVLSSYITQKGYKAFTSTLASTEGYWVNISPVTPDVSTPVQKAKQLFVNLRSTVNAYSNASKTGDLNVATAKLSDAAAAATFAVDAEMLQVLGSFVNGRKLYKNFKDGFGPSYEYYGLNYRFDRVANFAQDGSQTLDGWLPVSGCEVGKIVTTTTATGATDYSNYRSAYIYRISATAFSEPLAPSEVNAISCFGIGTVGRTVKTALDDGKSRLRVTMFIPQLDGSYKYVDQTRVRSFDRTGIYGTATNSSTSNQEGVSRYGQVQLTTDAGGYVTSANMTGELTPSLQMLKTRTVAELAKFSHHTVNLGFSNSSIGTIDSAHVSGSVKLMAANGTQASELTIANDSVLSVKSDALETSTYSYLGGTFCPIGDGLSQTGMTPNLICTNTSTYGARALDSMKLTVSASAPNFKLVGQVVAGNPMTRADGTGYQPTTGSFTGEIYEGDGAGGHRLLLTGTAVVASLNHNTTIASVAPLGKLTFDGKLMLNNRPDTKLSLTVEQTSPTASKATANFSWDSGWGFDLNSTDDTSTRVSNLNVISTTGVKFSIPNSPTYDGTRAPQPVYVGTDLVGTINLSTQRIDYSDGTFEQF